jgi:toxin-antitoxin system PIN domain toxin
VSVTVDVNVLLYASDLTGRFHSRALRLLQDLAEGTELVYVFWPTVMSYLRISTHPGVFSSPLLPADAMANVERLLEFPHVQTAGEQARFWHRFRSVADDADARGNLVPDAQLVALMAENGVRTIWTHDRDFRRFPGIDVRDPFAE